MSDAEHNKAVVRAYAEAFGCGDFETIRGLCTPNVAIQGVLGRGNWDFVLPIWQSLHDAYDMNDHSRAGSAQSCFYPPILRNASNVPVRTAGTCLQLVLMDGGCERSAGGQPDGSGGESGASAGD